MTVCPITGKDGYDSAAQAKSVAVSWRSISRNTEPYHCGWCGLYHVTTQRTRHGAGMHRNGGEHDRSRNGHEEKVTHRARPRWHTVLGVHRERPIAAMSASISMARSNARISLHTARGRVRCRMARARITSCRNRACSNPELPRAGHDAREHAPRKRTTSGARTHTHCPRA